MFRRLLVLLFVVLLLDVTCGFAASGDSLYITGSGVNVRSGPDTSRSVLMQLGEGHKLTELEHRGDWVRVHIAWIGGSGWVHQSLLSSESPINDSRQKPPAYQSFVRDVEQLNQDVLDILGDVFFTRVAYRDEGQVELTATRAWLSAPESDRQEDLTALTKLWLAHYGGSGSLVVLDPSGEPVAKMP